MKTKILYVAIILLIILGCKPRRHNDVISISYTADKVNDKVIRVTFLLTNNSSLNYFIPFIKPPFYYSKFSDKKSLNNVQGDLFGDYYLSNKILTKRDLFEASLGDSLFFDEAKDTMCFYFEEQFMKKTYDSILASYKNKKELYYIYPNFYQAVASRCLYLKMGETKKMTNYVYHYYPLDIENLVVSFNFDTDSIPFYKEDFFKYIPNKIEHYYIFNGIIKLKNNTPRTPSLPEAVK